jgi:hypothetical protein
VVGEEFVGDFEERGGGDVVWKGEKSVQVVVVVVLLLLLLLLLLL